MDETSLTQYIIDTFGGVDTVVADGNTFFMYDPDGMFPMATLMINDVNDQASNLDRPGVFRLNIGIGKQTYYALLGAPPSRPGASGIVETGHDFTALDQLMPHPVYANMYWVCVLNPSAATFQTVVQPLLAEAYELNVRKYAKRVAQVEDAENQ
jgi:hypothetical protein